MKEATGELSTTVITVVAIAAISALFITFLYPTIRRNIVLSQACSNGPGYKGLNGDKARIDCGTESNGKWTCTLYESDSAISVNTNSGVVTYSGGTAKASKTCDNK